MKPLLIISDDANAIIKKVQSLTANKKIIVVNQVSSARFIENYIDETTEVIWFRNLYEVNMALLNLCSMKRVFINPVISVPLPQIIITSTTLSESDFGKVKVTEMRLTELETVAAAFRI